MAWKAALTPIRMRMAQYAGTGPGPNGGFVAALSEEVKCFVVRELACFRTPSEVADRVTEEYGLKLDRRQIQKYNPIQVAEVAPKWRALFDATREAFLRDQASIGISQPAYRLRELQDMYYRAKGKKNDILAKEILEQAAKESGGAFTNRRELTGKEGRDLVPPPLNVIIEGQRGSETPPEAG